MEKFVATQKVPEDISKAWAKLTGVSVVGSALKLTMPVKRWLAIAGGYWFGGVALAVAATPVAVLTRTAAGRFEIASVEAGAAQQVRTAAEEAWRWLAGPLDLGEGFSTPIFVRLVPAADWGEVAPFRVAAEAGGVVSVRLRWSEATPELFVQRALVQALLAADRRSGARGQRKADGTTLVGAGLRRAVAHPPAARAV